MFSDICIDTDTVVFCIQTPTQHSLHDINQAIASYFDTHFPLRMWGRVNNMYATESKYLIVYKLF